MTSTSSIHEINALSGGDNFLAAINLFLANRQDFLQKAKISAPWQNWVKSNLGLLKWCRDFRDHHQLTETNRRHVQSYLDKTEVYPKLRVVNSSGKQIPRGEIAIEYQLKSGSPNIQEFDRDVGFEPGLIAIHAFARYLSDYRQGRRRMISDCAQCGRWFEWSGRGYANKFCSRKCRNHFNYIKHKA